MSSRGRPRMWGHPGRAPVAPWPSAPRVAGGLLGSACLEARGRGKQSSSLRGSSRPGQRHLGGAVEEPGIKIPGAGVCPDP